MKIHLNEYSPRLYYKIIQCKNNVNYLVKKPKKSQRDWKRARYWARMESKWCEKVDWRIVKNNVGQSS
jgi:hypothetical protein